MTHLNTSMLHILEGLTHLSRRQWQSEGTGDEGCRGPGLVGVVGRAGQWWRRGWGLGRGAPKMHYDGGCSSQCTCLKEKQS